MQKKQKQKNLKKQKKQKKIMMKMKKKQRDYSGTLSRAERGLLVL